MSDEDKTRFIKYVFLDIVSYSQNRSAEAQIEIIQVLNRVVKFAVSQIMPDKEVIYIPTGDGMCIALTDYSTPFDAHIRIALQLFEALLNYNRDASHERRFDIRIGLNAHEDNLVSDINGRANLSGAGITSAQRIMNLADGGTLLIGESVFDTLRHREAYRYDFKAYTAVVKHDVEIKVYQYVKPGCLGLNVGPPRALAVKEDEIDANFRRCLAAQSSTGNERQCMGRASEEWLKKLQIIQSVPSEILDSELSQQYSNLLAKGKQLLEEYQGFTGKIMTLRSGSMYRTFSRSKRMHLIRSFVLEVKWIIDQAEEGMASVRERSSQLRLPEHKFYGGGDVEVITKKPE